MLFSEIHLPGTLSSNESGGVHWLS